MADLDVQPKQRGAWWLWLLMVLFIIGAVALFFRGCGTKAVKIEGATVNWDSVDFNSARIADSDVTDTGIIVRGNGHYTIYTLGENILFATDQHVLQPGADARLRQISASLQRHFSGASIGIYGNTDWTGSDAHNRQLGADRAAAVKNWLINVAGIDSAKISIHSQGENRPVATNVTAAGRQQNRNVEIVAFNN